MNEQDRIMEEKILKREKFDTFLAYMLIVILLGCIGFMLYAKFIRKEENTTTEDTTNNNLTLTDISNSLNTSNYSANLVSDGGTFNSSVSNNALVITYVKDDTTLNLNIPLVNNELKVTIDNTNSEVITSIYEEIGTIICTHYNGDATSCRNILTNINENSSVDGIRYTNNGNNNIVYLDITKGYFVNNTNTYNKSTIVSLGDTSYNLNINNVNIGNINIKNNTTNVVFSGDVTTSEYPFDIIVRLYKDDESLIKEDKVTISDNSTNNFNITFNFDDTLKLEDLSKYSIDITR